MLVGVIVLVFLMLLALSVAAPRVAMEIKREREVESARRANQYVRAVQVYYGKFKHYPGSVEQLEKSNNQRFLRQKYIDPLTGKDDWRLIHVGENKTKVKGLFGEELAGMSAGLGSAAGMASPTGGGSTTGSTSAFGGGTSSGIGASTGLGSNQNSTFGAGSTSGSSSGSAFGSGSSTGGSGISSQNATDATGTGGPIMGVGTSKSGESIVVVNEKDTYQEWEFLYDPRIELLKAKSTLLGGISSGAPSTGGFGSPVGTPIGTPPTTGQPPDPTKTPQ
jgi:type II secretory pathway pseudopilin PulG